MEKIPKSSWFARLRLEPKTSVLITGAVALGTSWFHRLLGLMVLAVGVVNVLAWIFHWPRVIQLHPAFAPMQFNTALLFGVLGAGLLMLHPRRFRPVRAAAVVVMVLALATYLQYLVGADFGIDQFFVECYLPANPAYPGRMAANTAVCFFLSGAALWILARRSALRLELISVFFGVSVAGFASLAILSFLSGTADRYGWGNHLTMAVLTSACFILIGIELTIQSLSILLQKGLDWSSSLPIFVSLSMLTGTIALWQTSLRQQTDEIRKTSLAQGESIRAQILQALEDRTHSIERMARRLEVQPGMPESAWQADAGLYLNDLGVLEVMSVVTADKRVRWIHPLGENRRFLGSDLSKDEFRNRYLERSLETRQTVVTPVTELRQGGRGFIVIIPMFRQNKSTGFVVAAIRPAKFIQKVVRVEDFELRVSAGTETLFDNQERTHELSGRWSVQVPLSLQGQEWTLTVVPTLRKIREVATILPYLLLVSGVILAILLGAMVHFAGALRRQSRLIRQQRNFLDMVINASPLPIVVLDPDARVTLWNPACAQLFGWSEAEALGQPLPFVPPEQREHSREFVKRIMSSREQVHSDNHRRTKDGRDILIRVSAMGLRDESGEVYGLMALMQDVTQQEQARKAIQEARELAEQAAQSKSEFLANMSHEIRTPLNGIIGMSDLLLDTALPGEQKRYANIIQTSATTLLALINDILDISKIEAGKMQLEQLDFSLTSLVESQADILISKARQKKLSLVTFISPDLPQTLRGDPGRLGQILVNLVSNAIKFTSEGGVTIRVTESPRKPSTLGPVRVRFEVQDTGIGVSEQDREKLFKPFSQVDGSTARKYGGTGLGLSIAKKLVQEMGGEIGVDSAAGQGSTFWFEVEFNSITLNVFLDAKRAKEARILIVDPDPISLEVMKRYLNAWRLQADFASSPSGAVELAAVAAAGSKPYDLVLVAQSAWDPRIWSQNGISRSQRILIQEFGQSVPTQLEGITGILHKPVKQSQLYDLIAGTRFDKLKNERPAAGAVNPDRGDVHVLVADDVAANQLLTLKYLEKLGYKGQAVGNGREVLEALRQKRFDLILMDCQMPELDGYEATRQIRALPDARLASIPIVALTANAMSGDERLCLDAGMDDYLSKPFKRERLGEIIEKCLKSAASKSRSALG